MTTSFFVLTFCEKRNYSQSSDCNDITCVKHLTADILNTHSWLMICGYNYDMVSLYAEEVLFFLVFFLLLKHSCVLAKKKKKALLSLYTAL